ncbi:MAG: hypothetical protein JWP12_19 [Bacteroidetes bacterium]|nr:hypothetical protein [Bacteroidota bacterium]
MIWLIYSDVHGNLPAFEAMLKDCGEYDASACLGDLVNYGPWSNACVDLAMSLKNPVLIMGNHEEAFIDGKYPGENKLVQQFFNQTIKEFHRYSEIKTFKEKQLLDSFTLQHTFNNQYIYPDTTVELDGNYMIGHSHHQFHYRNNGFDLYNTGSVGQNRKVINVADYILYDSETQKITMKSVRYDLDLLITEMKLKQYPEECLAYYLNKKKA